MSGPHRETTWGSPKESPIALLIQLHFPKITQQLQLCIIPHAGTWELLPAVESKGGLEHTAALHIKSV